MNAWIQTAHLTADAAAQVTRRWFRCAPTISHKDASSPIVTVADLEAEAAMRAIIQRRHPGHGIHGEEGDDIAAAPGEPTWVLDPIDGTIAFSCGKPLFTTLIAITRDEASVFGLIDQSILGERWAGGSGHPATFNGARCCSGRQTDLRRCRLSSTGPQYFTPDQHARFQVLSSAVHITSWGGDAYSYALLASGQVDIVAECGLAWHDWAALVPVIHASGGVVTDWHNRPLHPGSQTVLASASPALHTAALACLQS